MWHILGVGAIGACWARKLKKAGENVTLILQDKERLQQFHDSGSVIHFLRSKSIDEQQGSSKDAINEQLNFIATTVSDPSLTIENLLICTKSYSLESAFKAIESRLKKNANIVLFCNGYGPQQNVARIAERFSVWAASTTEGANRTTPFQVNLAGNGKTQIGPLNRRARSSQIPLSHLEDHYEVRDIDLALWQKLAINACINPMTLIYGVANGELFKDYALQLELAAIANEISLLAQVVGKPLFKEPLIDVVSQVCYRTSTNYSSMLQDFRANRPTEINEITGTLVKIANANGVEFSKNRQLLAKIDAIYALLD